MGLGGATSGGVGSWWQAAAWVLGGRRRRLFHRADDGLTLAEEVMQGRRGGELCRRSLDGWDLGADVVNIQELRR